MTMAEAKPKIAICICTYDRYDLLPTAVESAAKQTLPPDQYEILVIDNSPDQEKATKFAKRFYRIDNLTYIVEETPGLSNARNVCARISRAPIVSFMDDDAIASPQWAEETLRAFEIFGPATMIVGGKVDPIWGAPRPSWVHDDLLGNLSVVDWGGEMRVVGEKEWVAGTNISFRVEAIVGNGGFPRNLGRIGSGSALLSNEEIQLIDRIRAAGGRVVYAPNARVSHLVDTRRLSKSWFRKRSAWQALSDFMMEPDRQARHAKEHWPLLLRYFGELPPHERTMRGLLFETEDADLFRWQLGAIYNLTTLMLAGFEGVELV